MHILRMRTNNMERRSFAKDIARTKEENDGLGACAAVRFLHKGHCLIIISVPGRQRTVPGCTILIMLLSLLSLLWFAVHGPVRWASRPPVFATFDLFILYNVVWRLRWLRGHLLAALRKLPTLSCHGDRLLARSLGRFVPVQIFPTWALHDMELFVSWPTSLVPMIPMVPM